MSRTISSNVLPIQRAMAGANPAAWQDGIVVESDGVGVTVAFFSGIVARLQIADDQIETAAGEPVAYHPVAELLSAASTTTTARTAKR